MSTCNEKSAAAKRPVVGSPLVPAPPPKRFRGPQPDLLDALFGHSEIFGGAYGRWPAPPLPPVMRPPPQVPVTFEPFPDVGNGKRVLHELQPLTLKDLDLGNKRKLSKRLKEIAAEKGLRLLMEQQQ